jgi:hypothetical protein
LTCETLVDGISQGARNIAIGTGIAAWGSGVWGTFLWGGSGRRKGYQMLPLGAEGRTVEQIFTYRGTERMRLYTYAVTVLPETKPSELTE